TGTPNGIDVLANDSDSNGEPITLHSFQTTTHRGGFVTRSRGSGPGGRDELIYTPSPTFTSGLDWFTYRIEDSSGQQSVAHVMILPPPQEPDPSIMADAVSVTSGEWSSSAVWSDSAPATTGKDYEIAASTTVDSAPAGVGDGGLVTFPGDSIRVESGGTLRLRHTSAGGNNHHRVDLKALRLEDGASLQSYNTAAGN